MKKIAKKVFILTLFILIIVGTNVYAVTPTLDQIVNAFNNCSTVMEYATYGSVWTASSDSNKLTISVTANDTTTYLEYTLEGSILNANFSENDALNGLMVTMVLTDSIGQLHGYSDGELFSTLNSDNISSYSVDNEGFEVKKLSDESYQIKIDINKKIPLIDASDVYIEVSDLEDLKDYISGDGFAEKSKGNVWFNKNGYDGENTVLIAEKEQLTENAYKSILAIIEVMFDSNEASNYFESNYSEISIGDKEFTGFKIEINPTKTDFEESLIPEDSGYEYARITIDKNLVNSAINRTVDTENDEEYNEENNDNESNNKENENMQATEKLPQAGKNMTIVYTIPFILIIAIISYKKYYKSEE